MIFIDNELHSIRIVRKFYEKKIQNKKVRFFFVFFNFNMAAPSFSLAILVFKDRVSAEMTTNMACDFIN